jgi:hypothetical protein
MHNRLVSGSFTGPCLAGYKAVEGPDVGIGLQRIDHVVGVSNTYTYMSIITLLTTIYFLCTCQHNMHIIDRCLVVPL